MQRERHQAKSFYGVLMLVGICTPGIHIPTPARILL